MFRWRLEDPSIEDVFLVHGAWHGGWCWSKVASILRGRGHTVFTPTQTGLGERSHLLSRSIDLEVFVRDVVNVLEWEDLRDVVLVGHSFGGNAISGAADRTADRIRQLIYLDAIIQENGQSAFGQFPKELVEARTKAAHESSAGLLCQRRRPAPSALPSVMQAAWVESRLTPHPFATYTSPLMLSQRRQRSANELCRLRRSDLYHG